MRRPKVLCALVLAGCAAAPPLPEPPPTHPASPAAAAAATPEPSATLPLESVPARLPAPGTGGAPR